jgi:hypothetical protein
VAQAKHWGSASSWVSGLATPRLEPGQAQDWPLPAAPLGSRGPEAGPALVDHHDGRSRTDIADTTLNRAAAEIHSR